MKKSIVSLSAGLGAFFLFSSSVFAAPVWSGQNMPAQNIELTTTTTGHHEVAIVGDLDGDGYDDAIFTEVKRPSSTSTVEYRVVYGSASRLQDGALNDQTSAVITSTLLIGGAYPQIAGGDINNDGYSDFIVGSNTGLYIVFGSAARLSGTVELTSLVDITIGTNFRAAYTITAYDLNDDGIIDYIINGEYIVWGDEALTNETNLELEHAPLALLDEGELTAVDIVVGDINADGYPDWVHRIYESRQEVVLELYYGSSDFYAEGATLTPSATTTVTSAALGDANAEFTMQLEPAGDLNKDGYDDFAFNADLRKMVQPVANPIYFLMGQASAYTGTLSLGDYAYHLNDSMESLTAMGSGGYIGDLNGDASNDSVLTASTGLDTKHYQVFFEPLNLPANATMNDLVQFSFTVGDAEQYNATSQTGTGDLDGDGYDDLIMAGEHFYVVYGRSTFTAPEGRIYSAEGKSNSRVALVRFDGTTFTRRPFAKAHTGTPKVDYSTSGYMYFAAHPTGRSLLLGSPANRRLDMAALNNVAQDEVALSRFEFGSAAKQEVVVLTRLGNTVNVYYFYTKGRKLHQVDVETFQSTATGLVAYQAYKQDIINVYDGSTVIASYNVTATGLTRR